MGPAAQPAWRETAEGLEIRLRLQPGASQERIEGVERLADGNAVVRARVGAPPEGGKANAALAKLLAKQLGVAKSAVTLRRGASARVKTLSVAGDPARLAARLARLLDDRSADNGAR